MGGGGGKTSQQTQETQIDPALSAAAKQGLQLAMDVGSLPTMNNFAPQVAAATPMQKAAMQGTNSAAAAFGMPTTQSLGLPNEVTTADGNVGYSTKSLYDAGMNSLTDVQRQLLAQFQTDPNTGAAPRNPNVNPTDIFSQLAGGTSASGNSAGKGGSSLVSPQSLAAIKKAMG